MADAKLYRVAGYDGAQMKVKELAKRAKDALSGSEALSVRSMAHRTGRPRIRPCAEAVRLARKHVEEIKAREEAGWEPSVDVATHENWAVEYDRLLRLDKRDPEEARQILRWSQQHSFWQHNILSGKKFRKHYQQMRVEWEKEQGAGANIDLSRLRSYEEL